MTHDEIIAALAEIEGQIARIRAALTVMKFSQATEFELTPPSSSEKQAKRATQMPAGWAPNHNDLQWAEENYPNVKVRDETDRFRDYCAAHGSTYKNWSAAFRNWIRNAARFAKADVTRLQGRPEGRAAALAETNRERRDRALNKLSALQQGAAARKVQAEGG